MVPILSILRASHLPDNRPTREPRPFLRRNYAGLIFDGGLFVGGMSFIAAETVLPKAMQSLGAPNLLIALAPVLVSIGFIWPQTLVAHRVERMRSYKRSVVLLGAMQRLPYLFAGLALLWFGESTPLLALACLALAPFLCGTVGGIQVGAYIEMTRRVLPDNRRASYHALSAVVASVLGLVAGGVIHTVLTHHPGPVGYGILHLLGFVFLMLSLASMALIQEPPPDDRPRPQVSLRDNLRSLPGILRHDRAFRAFVIMRVLLAASGLVTPFLALHALARTGAEASFLGVLVIWQTVGAIFGNLCSGWLGDRHGAGRPLFVGSSILAVSLGCLPWITEAGGFQILFAAYGFGWAANQVGVKTLALAIAPAGRLPTYSSMGSLLTLPAMISMAVIGGWLRDYGVPIPLVAIAAGMLLLISLIFLRGSLTWNAHMAASANCPQNANDVRRPTP
jgi:MFS family permease